MMTPFPALQRLSFRIVFLFLAIGLPALLSAQMGPGRYIKEVLPCNGCEVNTLFPVIQWPLKKGKNVDYKWN